MTLSSNIEKYLKIIVVLILNLKIYPVLPHVRYKSGVRLYRDVSVMDCTHVTFKVPYQFVLK